MCMCIYFASSEYLHQQGVVKIGMTEDPRKRLQSYRTGCPPGLTPSCDISYLCLLETTAKNRSQLFDYEDIAHNYFYRYRQIRNIPGDSEWFILGGNRDAILKMVDAFISSVDWVIRVIPPAEVEGINRHIAWLRRNYPKNLAFIKTADARISALNAI
jgi:hypothetical protein